MKVKEIKYNNFLKDLCHHGWCWMGGCVWAHPQGNTLYCCISSIPKHILFILNTEQSGCIIHSMAIIWMEVLKIVLVTHQIKEYLIISDILDMMHYFTFVFITNLEIHWTRCLLAKYIVICFTEIMINLPVRQVLCQLRLWRMYCWRPETGSILTLGRSLRASCVDGDPGDGNPIPRGLGKLIFYCCFFYYCVFLRAQDLGNSF